MVERDSWSRRSDIRQSDVRSYACHGGAYHSGASPFGGGRHHLSAPLGSVSYDTESKSRNASCVPFRGRGPRSGEGVDGGKNDYDILILCLIALKGKRLTTFCASLALLHPLLLLTYWIFRSLMLPYKSSSLVQNVFAVHRFARGPPIGGQENDRVSYLCSAPYTLLPLRGISPQGETRDMERKTGRHILHVPLQCVPLWW